MLNSALRPAIASPPFEKVRIVNTFASKGSQKWLQVAVNRRQQELLEALQSSGAIGSQISVTWRSPLEAEDFQEYRDWKALEKAGIARSSLKKSLEKFWPARGPVWDAIGITSEEQPIFVEAKAHIPEAASPATKALGDSKELIKKSLGDARKFYCPKATASWDSLFYQYANRLAHHYFLTQLNGVQSSLVFLYFVNASDMLGPMSEAEWRGAVRLIHAVLGLPADLREHKIFDAFLDAKLLQDAVSSS